MALLTFSECQDLFRVFVPEEPWESWAFMMVPFGQNTTNNTSKVTGVEISVIDIKEGCTDYGRNVRTTGYMPVVAVKRYTSSPNNISVKYYTGAFITSSVPVNERLFFPFIHL